MEYVINPSWFYWVDVVSSLRDTIMAMVVVDALIFVASAISGYTCYESVRLFPSISDTEKNALPILRRISKVSLMILPFLIVVVIFVPSKETMIQMLIAKFVTYDNAQSAIETIKSATDYIIQAINGIK